MRILIVSPFFPPLNSIGSLRPYSWAKFWSQEGHNVTVLTTKKTLSPQDLQLPCEGFSVMEIPYANFLTSWKKDYQGMAKNGPSSIGWRQRLMKAFHSIRSKTGILNACRMPDFTDLWIKPAGLAVKNLPQWDFVISTSGPYASHIVAEKLKKSGQAVKWIADYRDPWSDNFAFPGLFPFNKLENWLEKKLMDSADLITTVSEPFAQNFSKKYPTKKVLSVENGFDPDDQKKLPKDSVFPNDGKFRIVHTGSIYKGKRDFIPLFQAISELKHHSFLDRLEVIFVGTQLGDLNSQIEKYDLSNWIKSPGMVSREMALCMQRDAHALLFLPWNDPAFPGVLTGKIFEYLFSRTPIIAIGGNGIDQSQQLILDAKAGVILESTETIKNYLTIQLKEIKSIKTPLSEEVMFRYNRKNLAFKLLGFIEDNTLCQK